LSLQSNFWIGLANRAGLAATGAFWLLATGCGGSSDPASPVGSLSPAGIPFLSDVLVHVNEGASAQAIWNDHDLTVLGSLPDGLTYRVQPISGTSTAKTIETLQADTRVAAAEENQAVGLPILRQSSVAFNEGFLVPGDFYGNSLGKRLNLKVAHTGSKGLGITVAILDTGIDPNHEVLAGRLHQDSYDFVEGDADPSDLPDNLDNDLDGEVDEGTGHGTHVSGLVRLVAPSSKILALRVLNSDGQGNAYTVASAIEYAANHGARVITLSIRLTTKSLAVERAIQYAKSKGAILVIAAGNSGTVEYPAGDPRVWAVAALNDEGRAAWFTSAFSGVVLSAPGENILSAYWDGGYAVWSGTSMAAPLVAGSAALVLARNPGMTEAQVLFRLQTTARPIPGDPEGMGAGGVNPGLAVGLQVAERVPNYEAARFRFDD
jgi:subtilisin family serine protease